MEEKLKSTFFDYWDGLIDALPNLIAAVLVVLFFILIGRIFFRIIEKRFTIKWKETIATRLLANSIKWIFYLIGLIAGVDILGLGGLVSSLIAGAGITAIILGFAFKDIGENFLAGILLATNRPFRIGNIIEISGYKGVVKGMDLRNTHIRNVEGKDIFIPNAIMVKNVLVNFTKDGLLRLEFDIGMDLPSDIPKVKTLILDYLSIQPEVLKKPEPNVIASEIGDFALIIKVLFWVDILKSKSESPSYLGMTIRSKIIHEVKDLLIKNGFNIPSPIREHKTYKDPIQVDIKTGLPDGSNR